MVNILIITILIFLFIANIIIAIIAFILKRDLTECETNESPYCFQYICKDGNPATRIGKDGKIQQST